MPDETPRPPLTAPPATSAAPTAAMQRPPRRRLRPDLRLLVIGLRRRREPEPAADPALFTNPLRSSLEQRSLFGEILDWMLAPLLLLWPVTVTITYLVAQNIANAPFDRNLADGVEILADHLTEFKGEARLMLPLPVRQLLRADAADNPTFMVLGLRGELVAGDRDLPLPDETETPTPGGVKFRDAQLRNASVRIAYTWVRFADRPGSQPALIQVAETLDKRGQLANEIIRGVIVPQFIVLPIAVVLVWFGLTRGLAPLNALLAQIRERQPDDVSPIKATGTPDEVVPLVVAFNELLARMEHNLLTQRRFVADAAHQMKTPLAGLRTQAELAQRETDPQDLRRSLRQIAAAAERAAHLINQLLTLARAEDPSADLTAFKAVDLAELAREVVREWVPQAIARGIDLGYDGPDRPLRVIGVAALLRELLGNLLDNALRYSPAHARPAASVTVRVRSEREAVYLEVEDTGPGIPERERPLVFDRFYRVLGSAADGSGLGLAIVRAIAEQHDALLRVGDNPRAEQPDWPGTLLSVEFIHTLHSPPTLLLPDD